MELADEVVDWLRGLELRQFLPHALLVKGRVLAAVGERKEAEAALGEAKTRAEELGFRRPLVEIEWELSRLAAERGDRPSADDLAAHAASLLAQIADTIDDDDLRASFLALPKVRTILDAA